MKALCVLEAILRKKEDGNLSIVHTYFSENTDVIQRCADSPQSSLREKANKVKIILVTNIHTTLFLVLGSYDGLTQNTGFLCRF